MDIVSFRTAKALKEAGFPQPEHKDQGQVWYIGENYAIYVTTNEYLRGGFVSKKGQNIETLLDRRVRMGIEGEIFAPTATDILPHLPGYAIGYNEEIGFICIAIAIEYEVSQNISANPAEACAEAWLNLYGK